MAKMSVEEKSVGMECAITINDIIHSVELGATKPLVHEDGGLNRL